MNIRQKMLLGTAALTLIPVAFTSLLLWQGASTLSAETVGEQVRTLDQRKRPLGAQPPGGLHLGRTQPAVCASIEAVVPDRMRQIEDAIEIGPLKGNHVRHAIAQVTRLPPFIVATPPHRQSRRRSRSSACRRR